MANYRIEETDIAGARVTAQPDALEGTTQQNKAVFDAYSEIIKDKFNTFVDHAESDYGVTIDAEVLELFEENGWTPPA